MEPDNDIVDLLQQRIEELEAELASAEFDSAVKQVALQMFLSRWQSSGPQGSAQFEKFDQCVRMAKIATEENCGQEMLDTLNAYRLEIKKLQQRVRPPEVSDE